MAKAGKNNNLTLEDLGITSIKELEEFLSSDRLLELQKNGYGIRDEEQWRAIIDGNNSVLDKEKELQETMAKNRTGISLDEAQNALDDFIKNADSSFGDVADSFEDHMRDAMFNIVKQNYLNKALEDWYKDFEEAMSDGELSKAEAEESKRKYEEAYTGAQERYLDALKAAGISADSSYSEESSKRNFASMSQDSADELNGRFTAGQIAWEETKNQSILQSQSLNLLTMKSEDILKVNSEVKDIAEETRDLIANSYLELIQISENTGAIIKPIQQMQKDMAEVKKNTSKL